LQKCADRKVSDKSLYPTFARTLPASPKVSKSVIALLKYFEWKKVRFDSKLLSKAQN
jgi:guanylate cyclase